MRHERYVSCARQKAAQARWAPESHEIVISESQPMNEEPSQASSAGSGTAPINSRQPFRLKSKLTGLIPRSPLDNLDTFFQSLPHFPPVEIVKNKYKFLGQ